MSVFITSDGNYDLSGVRYTPEERFNIPTIKITSEDSVVDRAFVPFIRSRKIFFKVEGLLPNTKHKPFFDNVDVSSWCREETYVNVVNQALTLDATDTSSLTGHPDTASDLISDADGKIEGSFFIPNTTSIRFKTGVREFKLREFDATSDETAVSLARSNYAAIGGTELRNQIEPINLRVRTVENPNPVDMVSQSFKIQKTSGIYVTGFKIYFKSKPDSANPSHDTSPVRLQIREMENGFPTSHVIPGGEKIVLHSNVTANSSTPASGETVFDFEVPVYLEGFKEYAIVLTSKSNQYNVWTAETGEFHFGSTTRRVTKQSGVGAFFKSKNGVSWIQDQTKDLMFTLKRAQFNTALSRVANFKNVPTQVKKLQANPIEVIDGSTIRVKLPNHGFTAGDSTVLAGLTAMTGLTTGVLNATHLITSVEDFDNFTISVSGGTSGETGGGSAGTSEQQLLYNLVYPNVTQSVHPQTTAAWTSKYTPAGGTLDADYSDLIIGENNELDAAHAIESPVNEAVTGSLVWQANLTTGSQYVAPVINLGRLSATLIRNTIDQPVSTSPGTGENVPPIYVADSNAIGGSSSASHVFSPVTLENEAIGNRILFDMNRPPNSNISMWYRLGTSGSDASLSEVDWQEAVLRSGGVIDDNPNVFRPQEYEIETPTAPFTRYQYKVVFNSTNIAKTPRIKNFKSISLAT